MLKILMPVDFSDSSLNAFSYAGEIAKALHSQLLLLHVVEPIDGDVTMFVEDSMIEKEIEDARLKLNQLAKEHLQDIDPALIECRASTGFIVEKIAETIKKENISIVVMGTTGSGNQLTDLFGSNTYKVVKQATCAVLTVPPDAEKFQIRKIVLAAGLHHKENIHLLTVLKHLARHFDAEIIVLHVSKEKNPSLEGDVQSEAVLWLASQLKDFRMSFATVTSEKVADAINDYAIDNDIDLIAVSPEKHGPLHMLIEGSTTKKLVLHSSTPLLTLPADY